MTLASNYNGDKNMEIQYTIVDTYLGRMLVAWTERGVCALSFGDRDTVLEDALHAEYPKAVIRRAESAAHAWVELILAHLDGRQLHLDVPLDVQASAFQLRVWQELRKIPRGQIRTYTQVAEAIGRPTAIRAVAHACARNPVSLVTPCHRVVRRDGSLGGYRWGLERKSALLAHERPEEE
ncbi:MAG: methylated-DNA--[protein]-cysteine S-methyltransferase [Anaerolineaceae bacterium]|nr:methylated-DNA--[protein]-cysteine S-methyltransferase [Anaerolineaceae bacterium]